MFPTRVLLETKPGASAARNLGLKNSKTEWVYFFDSDDEISADFLNIIMPLSDNHDVVAFPVAMEVDGKTDRRAFISYANVSDQILSSTLSTQSMLFRKEWLLSIGGWNESLSTWDDWELGVRVLLNTPRIYWYSDKTFHHIYVHSDSQTGSSFTETLNPIQKAMFAVEVQLCHPNDKRALYYRGKIIEGQLAREHTRVSVNFGKGSKVLGWLLYKYSALGGRGAWRLASKLCSSKS